MTDSYSYCAVVVAQVASHFGSKQHTEAVHFHGSQRVGQLGLRK